MSKKTVVSVSLLCSRCKKMVMKSVAGIEGINSIVLDSSKNTVTVIGEADPVDIIKKVRKVRKSAAFVSIGAPPKDEVKVEKPQTEKPQTEKPQPCQSCRVWYVIGDDGYNYCSIL